MADYTPGARGSDLDLIADRAAARVAHVRTTFNSLLWSTTAAAPHGARWDIVTDEARRYVAQIAAAIEQRAAGDTPHARLASFLDGMQEDAQDGEAMHRIWEHLADRTYTITELSIDLDGQTATIMLAGLLSAPHGVVAAHLYALGTGRARPMFARGGHPCYTIARPLATVVFVCPIPTCASTRDVPATDIGLEQVCTGTEAKDHPRTRMLLGTGAQRLDVPRLGGALWPAARDPEETA